MGITTYRLVSGSHLLTSDKDATSLTYPIVAPQKRAWLKDFLCKKPGNKIMKMSGLILRFNTDPTVVLITNSNVKEIPPHHVIRRFKSAGPTLIMGMVILSAVANCQKEQSIILATDSAAPTNSSPLIHVKNEGLRNRFSKKIDFSYCLLSRIILLNLICCLCIREST